jgi:hypothetical protein
MTRDSYAPADQDARDDEYAELVQLIVQRTWRPGELVRTATGRISQFRATPHTAGFPDADQPHVARTAGVLVHAERTGPPGAVRTLYPGRHGVGSGRTGQDRCRGPEPSHADAMRSGDG